MTRSAGDLLLIAVAGWLLYNYFRQAVPLASPQPFAAPGIGPGVYLPLPQPIAPLTITAPTPVAPTPIDSYWQHFAQNFQDLLRQQQWIELQNIFAQARPQPGACPPGYYYDSVAGGCVHPLIQ